MRRLKNIAAIAAGKLTQVDGAQAILTFYTNVVSAQIPLAGELKIPIVGSIQTPGLMSHSAYTFSHAETVNATATLFGEYWKNHKFKRVYAFIPNNALGAIFSSAYKAAAAASGVTYDEATFNSGETDYRGVIARAKEFNSDGVIVASPGGLDGTVLIRQVREAGINSQIFLPGTFIDEPGIAKQLAVPKGVPSVFGGTITMDPDHYSVPLSNRLRQIRNGQLVLVN